MTSATPTDPPRLQIHIFGAGKGESIVVGLPDGRWGVVDCYATTPPDPATNPAIQLLNQFGVKELTFLCLTHPHDDHYRGMRSLWDAFPVRNFWRFGSLDASSIQRLVNVLGLMEADATGNTASTDELTDILRRLKRARGRPQVKHVASRMQLYPETLDVNADLQIWGVAPSGNEQERYERGILACVNPHGGLHEAVPHRHHNIISSGLVLQWRHTRVVLGGDVESRGWQDALIDCGHYLQGVAAVKVSHHGSTNGYCQDLWGVLSSPQSTIAVVTCYNRFNLPSEQALRHVREHCRRLIILGEAERASPVGVLPVSAGGPTGSRIALALATRARPPHSTTHFGRCSLYFDDMGNCVEVETCPPAFEFRLAERTSASVPT